MFPVTSYGPSFLDEMVMPIEEGSSINETARHVLNRIEREVIDPNTGEFTEKVMLLPCSHSISEDTTKSLLFWLFRRKCYFCSGSSEAATANHMLRKVIEVLKEEIPKEDFKVSSIWRKIHDATVCPIELGIIEDPMIRTPCGHSIGHASYATMWARSNLHHVLMKCETCKETSSSFKGNRPLHVVLETLRKEFRKELVSLNLDVRNYIMDEIDALDRLNLAIEDFLGIKGFAQSYIIDRIETIALLKEKGLLSKVHTCDDWTQVSILEHPGHMIDLVEKGIDFEKLGCDARLESLDDPEGITAIHEAGFFDEAFLALRPHEQKNAINKFSDYIQKRMDTQRSLAELDLS